MHEPSNDLWTGGPWEQPSPSFPTPPAVVIPSRRAPLLRPKRRWKRRRRPETLPMDTVDSLFEDTDEDSKQARMLHERIKKLGIFDRAILLLWLEDLTYREIGEIMGISADNVSVRLVRIREKMKNMK